jgi:restriction system protein
MPITMPQCRIPILQALVELGGRAESREVLSLVEKKVRHLMAPVDDEPDKGGYPRWQKTVHFCRLLLKQEGCISDKSVRGIWEITQKGRDRLKSEEEKS